MKSKYLKLLMALFLGTSLYGNELLLSNTKRSDLNALVAVFDTVGLNNNNSCRKLVQSNIAKYNSLVTKKNLRKSNISSIEFFSFDEQIQNIGMTRSRRTAKIYRESKDLMHSIKRELSKDKSMKAKDVISIFDFFNKLVVQSYSSHDNVAIVIFSNLRDSLSTKEQRNKMKPIKINDKITLFLYSASGLSCAGATTQEVLSAENSVEKYYKSLLIGSKIIVNNTYYGESNE